MVGQSRAPAYGTRMRSIQLAHEEDFEGWRDAARALAAAAIPASDVAWQVGDGPRDLFAAPAAEAMPANLPATPFSVPRAFIELARLVICHYDAERFALLYDFVLRLRTRPKALEDSADQRVQRLERMAREVRRDMHKMRAFLRFREVGVDDGDERFVAWFEPEHHIVRSNAGFFARRFATMQWSILTPELCAHWDGEAIEFTAGATRADAPAGDPLEETWKTYYASIFNPARLKTGAMAREMPKKYWKNMPETALVKDLVTGAQGRATEMVKQSRARIGDNALAALEALRQEAKGCSRCHLYKHATQTVFGEGPANASILFVGEQPGDQEDLAGRPFVGPAGQLFDRALAEAGIERNQAYVTNAVKHFKFERRGKRRIHQKPDGPEIEACRWWIEQERLLIRPQVTVALGATAARSLFGKVVTISGTRGKAHQLDDGGECWVTVHPSFLLRIPEADRKADEYARFVGDLERIRERVKKLAPA
jgi:uracil-DNA glycosylase